MKPTLPYNSGMSDGKKKPGVEFWATVVVAAAILISGLYVASFGPVLWVAVKLAIGI